MNTSSASDFLFSLCLYNDRLGIRTAGSTYTGDTIALNTWYHGAATYDGTTLKLYCNGVLSIIKTSPAAPVAATNFILGQRMGSTGNFVGKLNDVRVYDHCLSAKEIEEIAKGLVLHYKLDQSLPNLASGSMNLSLSQSKNNSYWGKRGSASIVQQNGFTMANCTAAWQGLSCWANQLNLTIGQSYTISCMGYTNDSNNTNAGLSFYPMMYNSAGTRDTSSSLPISVMGGSFTTVNSKKISNLTITPTLYWATFTWNQTMADILSNGGSIELSFQVHGTFNTGNIFSLYLPKIEVGTIPTTWRGTLLEENLTSDIVHDSSGYNNDGEVVNVLTSTSDTPRYQLATIFSNSAYIRKTDMNYTDNTWTICCWFKKTSSVTSAYETMLGLTKGNGADANKKFSLYIYNNKIGCVGEKTSNANIVTFDTALWHHACLVNNTGSFTYYMDGNSIKTFSNTNCQTDCTDFVVGGRAAAEDATSIGTPWGGNLSDVRLYAAALTAAQVKELYNTSVSIDNLGNVYARELNEN